MNAYAGSRVSPRSAWGWILAVVAVSVPLLAMFLYGFAQPIQWTTGTYAGGIVQGHIVQAPFGPLTDAAVFGLRGQRYGDHFYLFGSDAGGRDLVALSARGLLPSLGLVLLAVVVRTMWGTLMGGAMALGVPLVRGISRAMGRWVAGFPYLLLAIAIAEAIAPSGRLLAFVCALAVVGWRDVAEVVCERIEYVRVQPFALGAEALGTGRVRFFHLYVLPFLLPALAAEVAFQASSVLVLLAELGYLQVYLGGSVPLAGGANGTTPLQLLPAQPELGQLLSTARTDVLYGQYAAVLVPATAVALLALAFEVLGNAVRRIVPRG